MKELSDRYDFEFVEEVFEKIIEMTLEYDIWLCGKIIRKEMEIMQKESE